MSLPSVITAQQPNTLLNSTVVFPPSKLNLQHYTLALLDGMQNHSDSTGINVRININTKSKVACPQYMPPS